MTNIKWYSVYSTHQPEQCQSPKLQHRAECRRDRSGSAVSLCSTKSLDKKHNRKMLKKRCLFLSCTSTFEATDAHLQLALLLEPSITDILARWLGSKGSCYQKCWILLVKTCTSPPPNAKLVQCCHLLHDLREQMHDLSRILMHIATCHWRDSECQLHCTHDYTTTRFSMLDENVNIE